MEHNEKKMALEKIETAREKIFDLCADAEKNRWGNTNYHTIRYNPRSGDIYLTEDPSWSCSSDEYYLEHGNLSVTTLWYGQGWTGHPGPEDGYFWEEDENGELIGDFYTGEYKLVENLHDDENYDPDYEYEDGRESIQELESKGWKRFTVSLDPVDGTYEEMVEEINKNLDDLVEKIEEDEND